MILKNLCSKINKNIKIDKNIKINKSIKSDKPIKPDKLILTETYKNIELESKKEDNIYNFDTSNFTKKSFRELFIKIDNKIRTNKKIFQFKEEVANNYFGEVPVFLANEKFILKDNKKIEKSGVIFLFTISLCLHYNLFFFIQSIKYMWIIYPYFYLMTISSFYKYYKNLLKASNRLNKNILRISLNRETNISNITYENGLVSPSTINNIRITSKSIKQLFLIKRDFENDKSRFFIYIDVIGALKIKGLIYIRGRRAFRRKLHYSYVNFPVLCLLISPISKKIKVL